jgi:glycosyltransferase involved in cell wall biosynthesis
MKIHFVLPQLVPSYGMEKAAMQLMIGLQKSGAAVSATVVSGDIPMQARGLDIHALGVRKSDLRLGVAVPRLRRRLTRLPADVHIIASGLWASAPVGLALVGTGRSFVSWEHSVLSARLELDSRVRMLSRIVHCLPMRPRLTVAVSEGVARDVRDAFDAGRVVVISNVVDVPAAPPRPLSSGCASVEMLTVGALRPHKNHVIALTSLRFLPQHYRLSLAGDGAQERMLRQCAQDLGVADRVRFLGRVGDVSRHLRTSDLLLHPSLFETFGFSLIEAADYGLPVVTLPVPAIDELVPRFVPGTMAGAPTARALADAVTETVLRGRPTIEKHAEAWQRRRQRFSAGAVAARWLEELAA